MSWVYLGVAAVGAITAADQGRAARNTAKDAAAAALAQQKKTDDARALQEKALQEQQKNFAANANADLKSNSKTTVIAGGTADLNNLYTTDLLKKKPMSTNVAATLGIG